MKHNTNILYEHYSKDDLLLYVGITNHLETRTKQHKRKSPWFKSVHYTKYKKFETREDAYKKEQELIKEKRPPFNKDRVFSKERSKKAKEKRKIITFELQGDEIDSFERAFKLSGMRSRSELVRFILNQELKNYYKNET